MELIRKYFPDLSQIQLEQLDQLLPLYRDWNEKINVISRKDLDNLYERHVLHSLSIARFVKFKAGTVVIDIGTGGGFPGIPLAIAFPEVDFYLVDSIAKKIRVVEEVTMALNLQNVEPVRARAEELKVKGDFIVCRAVTGLPLLVRWAERLVRSNAFNEIPNGLLALKGGDLNAEVSEAKRSASIIPISKFFGEEFFADKSLIFVPLGL